MPGFNSAILSTAYLPDTRYLSKWFLYDKILIERFENYQKQSYRNRCVIYAANGPLTLVIPVVKNHGEKTLVKDVLVDYDLRWQHQHWKSIHSAYKNSPFFDFYEDDFYPFYIRKEKYLFDFNISLIDKIMQLLGMTSSVYTTSHYGKNSDFDDYRNSIHPKQRLNKPDRFFTPSEYHQVFADKHGFIANLSTIDLLFNAGPDAVTILKNSTKKGQ